LVAGRKHFSVKRMNLFAGADIFVPRDRALSFG
jgi:hypothetical protein